MHPLTGEPCLSGIQPLVQVWEVHTADPLTRCPPANFQVAVPMGKALLEFVWALRFHVDT